MQELSALLRPYSKHSRALRTVRTGVGSVLVLVYPLSWYLDVRTHTPLCRY